MRITFDIPDELDWKLRKLAEDRKTTPEEYARRIVQAAAEAASFPPEMTPEERIAELQAWLATRKPVEHVADDSRESIYEGCGE